MEEEGCWELASGCDSDVFEIDLPITILVLSDDDFTEDEEQEVSTSNDLNSQEKGEETASNDVSTIKNTEEEQRPSDDDNIIRSQEEESTLNGDSVTHFSTLNEACCVVKYPILRNEEEEEITLNENNIVKYPDEILKSQEEEETILNEDNVVKYPEEIFRIEEKEETTLNKENVKYPEEILESQEEKEATSNEDNVTHFSTLNEACCVVQYPKEILRNEEEEEITLNEDNSVKYPEEILKSREEEETTLNKENTVKYPEEEQVSLHLCEKHSTRALVTDLDALSSSKSSPNYEAFTSPSTSTSRIDPVDISECAEGKGHETDDSSPKVLSFLSRAEIEGGDSLTNGQVILETAFTNEKELRTKNNSSRENPLKTHCTDMETCVNTEDLSPSENKNNEAEDRTRKERGSEDETLNSGKLNDIQEDLSVVEERESVQSTSAPVDNEDSSILEDLPENAGESAMNGTESIISEDHVHLSLPSSSREMESSGNRDMSHVITKHLKQLDVKQQEETLLLDEYNSKALSLRLSAYKHKKRLNFKCRFCSSAYKCTSLLKNHIYSVHQDKKIHKCCFCQRTFFFFVNLKFHLAFHKAGLKCIRKYNETNIAKDGKSTAQEQSLEKKKESKYEKFFIKIGRDFKTIGTPTFFSCKVCLFASPNPKVFIHHMKGHRDTPPYRCPECDYSCISLSYMLNHMYWHAGYELYKCRFCNFFSLYFASMVRHSYMHKGAKPYSCEFCQSAFTSTSGLKRHRSIHAGKELCRVHQHLGFSVLERRNERPSKSYTCDQCNIVCYTKGQLRFHKKFHKQVEGYAYMNEGDNCHRSEAYGDDGNFQKDQIPPPSNNSDDDHLVNETPPDLASGSEFEQESNLQKDMNTRFDTQFFKSSQQQSNNLSIVDNGSENLPNTYQQDFVLPQLSQEVTHSQVPGCNEIVTNYEPQESVTPNATWSPSRTSFKLFRCQHCDYATYMCSNLKLHLRTHTGEKPFECNECSKMFRTSSHLRRHSYMHLQECHKYDDSYLYLGNSSKRIKKQCKTHGTTLRRDDLSSLEDLERVHSMFSPESFEKPVDLYRDKESKNALPSRSQAQYYKCAECNYMTYVLSNLKLHVMIHTGEKPHACDICEKKFRTSSHLNRHKLLHFNMELFKCKTCDYSTGKWQTLKQHLVSHMDGTKLREQSPLSVKTYRCQECGYATAHSGNLKQHVRIHTGERPYTCDQCDLAFRTSSHLKRHLLTHLKLHCTSCEFSTRDKYALKKHIKVHKDKPADT